MNQSNPWKTNESREIYSNAWISLREDAVTRPDGAPGVYGVVSMKNRAVGVVPLHADGSITLVGQWRYTMESYSWEIPEGGCPDDEEPIVTARRELQEETGLIASIIEPLGGEIHLSNSVTDERGYLFVAMNLVEGESNPEGTEKFETKRVSLEEAISMAMRGEINDSLSVLALLFLEREIYKKRNFPK